MCVSEHPDWDVCRWLHVCYVHCGIMVVGREKVQTWGPATLLIKPSRVRPRTPTLDRHALADTGLRRVLQQVGNASSVVNYDSDQAVRHPHLQNLHHRGFQVASDKLGFHTTAL